jgi:hypothetical protein
VLFPLPELLLCKVSIISHGLEFGPGDLGIDHMKTREGRKAIVILHEHCNRLEELMEFIINPLLLY